MSTFQLSLGSMDGAEGAKRALSDMFNARTKPWSRLKESIEEVAVLEGVLVFLQAYMHYVGTLARVAPFCNIIKTSSPCVCVCLIVANSNV